MATKEVIPTGPPKEWLSPYSSYFESLFEHALSYDLMRAMLMRRNPQRISVSRSEIDDSGIDLVLTCGKITRHVQIKNLNAHDKPKKYAISEAVFSVPGGCLVIICYDLADLRPTYRFFGAPLNETVGLARFAKPAKKRTRVGKVAKEGYVTFYYSPRQMPPLNINELAECLFGPDG